MMIGTEISKVSNFFEGKERKNHVQQGKGGNQAALLG